MVASAELDGRSTTPERLYAWLADIPIEARANLGGEGYAAALFQVLAAKRPEGTEAEAARLLLAQARRAADGDPIEAAAALFRGREAVTATSRLAYWLFLRDAFGPAEPPISRFLYGLQAATQRSRGEFDRFMAGALYKAARQALGAARTLLAVGKVLDAVYDSNSDDVRYMPACNVPPDPRAEREALNSWKAIIDASLETLAAARALKREAGGGA